MTSTQLTEILQQNDKFEYTTSDGNNGTEENENNILGGDIENDSENIPYHARVHARPFTYGSLPQGFNLSELNHVKNDKILEEMKYLRPPPSPSSHRKRPSITPSPPVLRKTPTRQEFEEMLQERQKQAMRDEKIIAKKIAQSAEIQQDLIELQKKLNKKMLPTDNIVHPSKQQVNEIEYSKECLSKPNVKKVKVNKYEAALISPNDYRPETPAFPNNINSNLNERCISPYNVVLTNTVTHDNIGNKNKKLETKTEDLSMLCNEPHVVEPHLVKFAKDSSEFWYKPYITREEAIALLRNTSPGTFLIRDSTTFKNAYGLVLRVVRPPPGIHVSENSNGDELVRHYLIEPTARGVRLKGCINEPIFTSLSAFVYQHSTNQLALPCKLNIPESDLMLHSEDSKIIVKQKQLLEQGAACNVFYLFTYDTESLTGDEAIRKTINELYSMPKLPSPIEVHFKISLQGITITDNKRQLFLRRHYAAQNISHFGLDPENRFWNVLAVDEQLERVVKKPIFAFVARPMIGGKDNECHVFCDLDMNQPASAILSFAHRVLPLYKHDNKML